MGDIVVAVVDDAIVGVGRVVAVGGGGREVSQTAQHTVGILRGLHQVTTHLTLEYILVGNLLHSLKNAIGIEHGVGLLVELRVKHLALTLSIQHVGA